MAADIVLVTRDIRRIDAVAAGRRARGGAAGHGRQRADRARDAAHQRRAHGRAAADAAAQRSGRLVVPRDHAVAVDARRRLLVRRQPQQPVRVRDRRHVDDRRRRRERHRAARQLHRVLQGSENRPGEQQRRVAEPRPGHHRLEVGHEPVLAGVLFDYYQSPMFRARNPFSGRRPAGVMHFPGLAVGGPVVIPRLYDGHGRTFWFVSGETVNGSSASDGPEPDRSDRGLAAWRLLGARTPDSQSIHRRGVCGRPHSGGGLEPGGAANPEAVLSAAEHRQHAPRWSPTTTARRCRSSDRSRTTPPRASITTSARTIGIFGRFTFHEATNPVWEGNLPAFGMRNQRRMNKALHVLLHAHSSARPS